MFYIRDSISKTCLFFTVPHKSPIFKFFSFIFHENFKLVKLCWLLKYWFTLVLKVFQAYINNIHDIFWGLKKIMPHKSPMVFYIGAHFKNKNHYPWYYNLDMCSISSYYFICVLHKHLNNQKQRNLKILNGTFVRQLWLWLNFFHLNYKFG